MKVFDTFIVFICAPGLFIIYVYMIWCTLLFEGLRSE